MQLLRAWPSRQPRLALAVPDPAWETWFAGKHLTTDWTSQNFRSWAAALSGIRDRQNSILEIGSWEGRSALFFLNYMPKSRITCVDTFMGSPGFYDRPHVEPNFDYNVSEFSGRVRKIKSKSDRGLLHLADEGAQFDVAYIDGSHTRDDTLVDSLLAWPLLRSGAIVIWDDYLWGQKTLPDEDKPQSAIDFFLKSHALDVIHVDYQVIARKR